MKKLLLLFAVICPSVLFAQGSQYQSILLGPTGRPLAGAQITVCSFGSTGIPCQNSISIYSDPALSVPISNPTSSDSLGNWEFWAAPGNYVYTVTGPGITQSGPFTISVPCNASSPSCSVTTSTFASLPVSPSLNALAIVTDGNGLNCSAGGGTFRELCQWNGSAWVLLTSGNGPLLPNTALAFSATPAFAVGASVSYSMTLTGNVTSSTTSGTPVNGNLLSLTLVEDATGGRTFSFPANFVFPVGYTFDTTATHTNALTFKFDGTNWNLISNSGSGSGTATLQNPLTNTGLSNGAFPLEILGDFHVLGPNMGVDATLAPYNVRALGGFGAAPQTTATITGATAAATVASATGFQVGDGAAFVNAGATNCATAPGTPTITPSLAANATGTGWAVAGGAGSTSVTYAIAAYSQGGCYTAATTATTTTANAADGPANIAITSMANSAGTVTITVGSTAGLATGVYGCIQGTSDDLEFAGCNLFTVSNGTQLTATVGNNSLYGMVSASSTGGTFYYYNENHIAFPALPAGTNMLGWFVWRCAGSAAACALPANASSYVLVYKSYPENLGYTDSTYNTWDDFGSTMTQTLIAQAAVPWWTPTYPPSANVNDMFVTTITGISGTTFTLAANAPNSASATAFRFDNAPGIALCNATANSYATGGGGTCYLPPLTSPPGVSGNAGYVTSSYLKLTGATRFGGPFLAGDTIDYNGKLLGTDDDTKLTSCPGYSLGCHIPILSYGANPLIWMRSGSIRDLTLRGADNAIGVFSNASNATIFENVTLTTNQGASDFMGIPFYYYNDTAGTGQFGGVFRNVTFQAGPTQTNYTTATPAFLSKNGSEWVIDYMSGGLRTFYNECNASNTACTIRIVIKMGEEVQGPITPILTINHSASGNIGGYVNISNSLQDSSAVPWVTIVSNNGGTFGGTITLDGINQPGSSIPVISGQPTRGSIFIPSYFGAQLNQIGDNTHVIQCGQANSLLPGCSMPNIILHAASYSANHTLNHQEGQVVATATLTFTADCTQPDGTSWDVYSQTGTTTLAPSATCTLYGNGTTGNITIPNGQGVHVFIKANTANAYGLGGGGGLPSGGLIGQSVVNTAPATGAWSSPGLPPSSTSPVSTASYAVRCDSGTTLLDRSKEIHFTSGASAPTLPLSSGTGCTNLFVRLVDDTAGSITVSRTSTDTFVVYTAGSSPTTAQTSFTLVNGQYANVYQNTGYNSTDDWEIYISPIGTTQTIASGTAAMGTTSISSGACSPAVTVSATGVATTDAIGYTPNTDPTALTGYAPSSGGSLYIWAYPTSGNVNFKVCNPSSGTITPSALTLNWRVSR